MKCDELKAYKGDVTIPVYGTIADAEVYLKDKADEVIAELKKENERLKDELDAANNQCENLINSATDIMLRQDKANDAKCDEIESLKATAYAESVDAGMRERRLRRSLWRAIALFCARSCEYFNGIMSHCLMGQEDLYNRCEKKKNKYLHAMYKCRAKAEEYK